MGRQQQVSDDVCAMIVDLFGIDLNAVDIDTPRDAIPEWDSLQHMNLVLDVERHFEIHLDESAVAEVRSVRELVNAIQAARGTEEQT